MEAVCLHNPLCKCPGLVVSTSAMVYYSMCQVQYPQTLSYVLFYVTSEQYSKSTLSPSLDVCFQSDCESHIL